MSASSRHRWLDRLLGAGVGIAAAALWFAFGREAGPVAANDSLALPQGATDDRLGHASRDGVPSRVTSQRSPGDLASATAATTPTSGRAVDVASTERVAAARLEGVEGPRPPSRDADDAALPSDPPPAPTDIATAHAEAAADPRAEAPTTTAAAPPLPLPRMPGDTKLSTSARWDETSSSWVLKGAYRVHARSHHVIAFYRKALLDQGLSVSIAEDPPTPEGAVKTYLRGKSSRVHAQVGIMPRTDSLETRVWILWRTGS